MDARNEFLTLLVVTRRGEDLVLRLDVSEAERFETYKNGALEVSLINCVDADLVVEYLKTYVGELIWNFEYSESEGEFSVLFEKDAYEVRLKCDRVLEHYSDLTMDELCTKYKFLDDMYQQELERSVKGWSKYKALCELLTFEIEKERENWISRKAFFAQTNPERAENANTVVGICQRFLNYIKQVDENDK